MWFLAKPEPREYRVKMSANLRELLFTFNLKSNMVRALPHFDPPFFSSNVNTHDLLGYCYWEAYSYVHNNLLVETVKLRFQSVNLPSNVLVFTSGGETESNLTRAFTEFAWFWRNRTAMSWVCWVRLPPLVSSRVCSSCRLPCTLNLHRKAAAQAPKLCFMLS